MLLESRLCENAHDAMIRCSNRTGKVMQGLRLKGQTRGTTLLPEGSMTGVEESNPVSAVDVFVDELG